MSHTHRPVVLLLASLLSALLSALLPAQEAEKPQLRALRDAVARISHPEHRFQFLLSRARDTRTPRGAAAEELLARETGAAKRLRKAAVRSSSRTRGAALAALVRCLPVDLAFAVRQALDDRSVAVRRRVFETVRRTGKTAAVREILREDLIDKDAAVRMRAGRGLVELRDPKAIPYLVAAAAIKPCSCKRARRPRAHVAFVTQTAVLSRMSAEIA